MLAESYQLISELIVGSCIPFEDSNLPPLVMAVVSGGELMGLPRDLCGRVVQHGWKRQICGVGCIWF